MAAEAEHGPSTPWTSPLGRAHPLAGRIWDVGRARLLDPPALVASLAGARFVLLGEKHDNPDHHRLQAWVVAELVAAGRRPAVAFEMLGADTQAAIDRHLARAPDDAAGLADAVDWKRSGWPDWAMYRPIAEAAMRARLPIVAANLGRARLQALRAGGLAALDAPDRAELALDQSLAPAAGAALASEIRDAHCGHASAGSIERMIDIQRARDATMAGALLASEAPDGAVLIAGTGHVRTDRGVPLYLGARRPGTRVASLAFLEVRDEITTVAAYAGALGGSALPFDYVWFTARVDDEDPCQRFRKSLEDLKGKR
jgi:uncharacterized iron-regulated protein